MTTDKRDFAPLLVAAIAQQLSHDPKTVSLLRAAKESKEINPDSISLKDRFEK